MTGAQEHLGVTVESSVPADHGDEESNSAPEEAEPDDPAEQSGHIHPAEVIALTDESGSSVDVPVLNSDPLTLLTFSVSVTLSTPSVEVEASSPEIITFIPEISASSGAVPLEDIQDKLEQEGLGGKPKVFLSTTQNITHLEQREQDASEGSGESSGERPEVTSPTLLMDQNEAGTDTAPPSDVKITLIPHQTLTPGWEPEPSSSAPQESRSDREYSAEPPVTEESDNVSKEEEAEVTSSSINGEFKGIPQTYLLLILNTKPFKTNAHAT